MIMIWNLREVYVGPPTERLKSVFDALIAHKIKFKYKVFNDKSAHFLNSRFLTADFFGLNKDQSRIYYVYVHKKDHNRACEVLQKYFD
jgi:hypothetical protein